jgi:Transcription factor WhiB
VSARLTSVDLPGWTAGALCAQVDPELFFPEKGGSVKDALRVCARCEIRARCAAEALANAEHFGVWGGLTERKRRRKLRDARHVAAASVVPADQTAPEVLGGEAA